jgi:hypothetical protein
VLSSRLSAAADLSRYTVAKKLGELHRLRLVFGSKNRLWFTFWWWPFIDILKELKIPLLKDFENFISILEITQRPLLKDFVNG